MIARRNRPLIAAIKYEYIWIASIDIEIFLAGLRGGENMTKNRQNG